MPSTRIIFMGTPEFAVPSLELLIAHNYPIAAVVTAPDKPRNRGRRVTPSPVKLVAENYQIPVLQPTNLKDTAFLDILKRQQADLYVVVAFRMLPKAVWSIPRLGTFNLHASLLPAYRGAAPINWAVINGEPVTGVTTFFVEESIDTGHILFQDKESIYPQDTAGTLHNRLQHKGAQLVLHTVGAIEQGRYTRTPQAPTSEELLKTAPKVHKEDCRINWNQKATAVVNFIRGLSPLPAAWSLLNGQVYKVLAVKSVPEASTTLLPGRIHSDGKHYIHVGTQSSSVALQTLQKPGKKPLQVADFLRGNQL
ncbi:MAG: methionyl-tRNA formyltransferase [Bacteroidota bacterium]